MPQKRKTLAQFIKFGIVGASNTAISLIVYYIFIWINQQLYLWGNIAGWVISVANAFFWNNKYVFRETGSKQDVFKKLGKTYLSYGATFLLSMLMLYTEVGIIGLSAVLCPIINFLVTIPMNFILNKYWTFR